MSRAETRFPAARHAETARRGTAKQRAPIATIIAAVVLSVVVLAFLTAPLFGVRMYVITGGSMNGSIDRGALIFTRTVPVSSLKVGDVITFCPPEEPATVTHRIISIDQQADGRAVFMTKGDFNEAADPWQFTLDRPVQAKYVTQVPYLGYALAFLSLRIVRALLFAIPALCAVLWLFFALWQRSGNTRWLGRSVEVETALDAEEAGEPRQLRRVTRRR